MPSRWVSSAYSSASAGKSGEASRSATRQGVTRRSPIEKRRNGAACGPFGSAGPMPKPSQRSQRIASPYSACTWLARRENSARMRATPRRVSCRKSLRCRSTGRPVSSHGAPTPPRMLSMARPTRAATSPSITWACAHSERDIDCSKAAIGVRPIAAISRASPGRSRIARAWSRVAGTISISNVHLRNQIEDGRRQRIALAHEDPAVAVPFARHADLPVAAERLQGGAERLLRALLDLGERALVEADAETAGFLHAHRHLADLLHLPLRRRAALGGELEVQRLEVGGVGQADDHLAVGAIERDRAAGHDLARHDAAVAQDRHRLALEMIEAGNTGGRRAAVLQAAIDEPGIGDGREGAAHHALKTAAGL